MPSKKHERIKKILLKASNRMRDKGQLPRLKHMRHGLEMGTMFSLLPWGVRFKKIQLENNNCFRKVPGEVIIPSNPKNTSQIILYLHGGGYTIGSSHTHRALVGKLAKKTGRIVIIPEYRKAPENPFPAALQDAALSYKSLLDRGKHPKNIILVGDSAGGGLAIALQIYLQENNMPLPGAAVCFSPWVDLAATGESIETNKNNDPLVVLEKLNLWANMYADEYPVTHPQISPLYADMKGLSPMLIQTSSSEMLYSDATRLAEKAEKAGVEVTLQVWDGLIHWWHLFQKRIPEACEAISKAADYMNEIFAENEKYIGKKVLAEV